MCTQKKKFTFSTQQMEKKLELKQSFHLMHCWENILLWRFWVMPFTEEHICSYVAQEKELRCPACPPGDLRWSTPLAPNTESAAFLCYLESSPTVAVPLRDRAGLWKSSTSQTLYSWKKGEPVRGGEPSTGGRWVFGGRMCRPSRKINKPFWVNSMWTANGMI